MASKFSDHFANLCYTSNSQRYSSLLNAYTAARTDFVGFRLTDWMLSNVELVVSIISDRKHGKAAGLDGVTAEHLKFSHPALAIVLVHLFSIMLNYGIVPDDFGNCYTVSISKSEQNFDKNLSTDDFRGISICPVISEVFDHCSRPL